jgi:hypothetical protein
VNVSRVASGLRQYSRKTFDPPRQNLAVVGELDLDARKGLADRAEAELVKGVHATDARRLRHPPALEHRNTAGVEELQDLGRDRGGTRHGLLDVAAEQPADVPVERLVRLLERDSQGVRDLLAALLHPVDPDAELDGLPQPPLVLRGGVVLEAGRSRGGRRLVGGAEHDAGPVCDECLGRGEPKAAAAAGHEVNPVAQSQIHAATLPWRAR